MKYSVVVLWIIHSNAKSSALLRPVFSGLQYVFIHFVILSFPKEKESQSRWPHDLSGRSVAAGFLGWRV